MISTLAVMRRMYHVINPILSTTVDTTLVFLVTSILHCIKNHRSSHHQITGGGGLQIYGREQGCTGPGLNVSRGGEGVDWNTFQGEWLKNRMDFVSFVFFVLISFDASIPQGIVWYGHRKVWLLSLGSESPTHTMGSGISVCDTSIKIVNFRPKVII